MNKTGPRLKGNRNQRKRMRINIQRICPLRVQEAAWRRLTGAHLEVAQAGDALGGGLHKGGKSALQLLGLVHSIWS
jgi:hypothetical protein